MTDKGINLPATNGFKSITNKLEVGIAYLNITAANKVAIFIVGLLGLDLSRPKRKPMPNWAEITQ
jgi:hypothetical protein